MRYELEAVLRQLWRSKLTALVMAIFMGAATLVSVWSAEHFLYEYSFSQARRADYKRPVTKFAVTAIQRRDEIKELKSAELAGNELNDSSLTLPETDSLAWLDISRNHFERAPKFSGVPNLKQLFINDQQPKLKELDVRGLHQLTELHIDRHALRTIDVRDNENLALLSANNNEGDKVGLTEVDLSHNPKLNVLHLKDNHLTELRLENICLSNLNLHGNQLKKLDLQSVSFSDEFSYADLWQSVKGIGRKNGSQITVDMKALTGEEDLSRLRLAAGQKAVSWDAKTGLVTITPESEGELSFVYEYNTKNRKPGVPFETAMPVVVHLTVQPQPKQGWLQLSDGRWIYLNADGKRVKSAWKGEYYLKSDGIMADREWIYDPNYGAWYYLKQGGRYARLQWQGAYFLLSDGRMAVSRWIYDKQYKGWYYLTKTGAYARNTVTPDGYRVDRSGKWVR
ncbi:MAG: hypothetical protein SPL15_07985 [Lachnospiraceae bacterium]|nr:hypothetical protein [Lachnospiraceae bacterium]